ncbi:MAG: histidine kinase [Gallionella sp.]
MPGTVLHIKPSADFAREATERLASQLSTVIQRFVNDVTSLDAALHEQEWRAIFCEQDEANNTHYSFMDSLPGMACQIRLDKQGALHFPYVSEGCFDLLGLTPLELQHHPQLLKPHPDDAESFRQSMLISASGTTPWNWEGRIVLPSSGHARSPHLNPDGTTSQSTRASKNDAQVAGYLPLAGEEANESLREIQVDEIKWVNLRAKYRKTNSHGTHWKGFVVNISQNKQAEIELKHSRQRLRELSSHIESIKEEERTRIAREIHDEIGVLLTALKMDLSWLTLRLPTDNIAIQEKIQGMAKLLDTAGRAANNLVHSLRPGSLDCFGIVASIEIEANEFTKRTGIPCKIIKTSDNLDVSDEQSITLFRVFQETLNNIMKHASARHVQVQILKTGTEPASTQVKLIVSDDGCGFDETARNKPRSFGLRGIQERIRQLGGEVTITSKPGKGTKIDVRLPINA